MKTITEIATLLNINRQRVYRYIKNNNINESSVINNINHYDDSTISTIAKALGVVFDDHLINDDDHLINDDDHLINDDDHLINELIQQNIFLKNEIDTKNKHINELHNLLNQQQQLNLHIQDLLKEKTKDKLNSKTIKTIQKENKKDTELIDHNKKWWQFWKI